jgi:hypothetical protein
MAVRKDKTSLSDWLVYCTSQYAWRTILQFAFVLEVGVLDVVDQPFLGELDGVSAQWSLESLQLLDEVNVQRIVSVVVSIAGLLHHALLMLEMFIDEFNQTVQSTSVTWAVGTREDAVEQTSVFSAAGCITCLTI